MAIGAITEPKVNATVGKSLANYSIPNKRYRIRDVQLTAGANYTTGGSTISAASVGLRFRIEHVINCGVARTTTGGAASIPISVDYSPTDGSVKLQNYVAATGAEQAGNADLSTFSVRLVFVGE
jgi:hypothetical protein